MREARDGELLFHGQDIPTENCEGPKIINISNYLFSDKTAEEVLMKCKINNILHKIINFCAIES